ncbi:MAG: porin [Rhodospirillales bacterium]|nr:porin [Rhodospirillales bacterium]
MKKYLYSSTALAAATALALLPSSDAQSAEMAKKIQLGFGGSFTSLVGFATQDESFEQSNNSDVSRTHYDSFNNVNDSEVEVKGSIKLENGITVYVEVEIETDQQTNATGASIDHSYMKLTGGFGDVRLGSTAPATAVLAQTAPWVGPINPGVDTVNWIIRPTNNSVGNPQGKFGTNNGAVDTMAVNYISPQVSGFRVGLYYRPSSNGGNTMPAVGGTPGTDTQSYGAVLNYETKMGSTSVKAHVGNVWDRGAATSSVDRLMLGGRLGFGDITVGGAYNRVSNAHSGIEGTTTSSEGEGYEVGLKYAPKGYSLSLTYHTSSEDLASATQGEDSITTVNLGGTYNMGPGVDLVGAIFWQEYEDELTTDADNNDGFAVVGGVKVSF